MHVSFSQHEARLPEAIGTKSGAQKSPEIGGFLNSGRDMKGDHCLVI